MKALGFALLLVLALAVLPMLVTRAGRAELDSRLNRLSLYLLLLMLIGAAVRLSSLWR
ncbi:MAG: hypothetical protein HY319_29080 [Armatimonadetes bacterium]|nr:hypothetical protein [Armatimonadota bacterium]